MEYGKIIGINSDNKTAILSSANEERNETLSMVMKNCLDLVTVHSRPFSIIEDKAFRNIIKLVPNLTETDQNSINVKKIKAYLEENAHKVRTSIYKEVKNKLIALKIDVASVKSRRFLGVNIQYISDDKIVLRNLSVLKLHDRNTAEFLKETITVILSRFGIELEQLYSITSDNGAKMLSMSRQMDEALHETYNTSRSRSLSLDENDEHFIDNDDYAQFQHCSLTELS